MKNPVFIFSVILLISGFNHSYSQEFFYITRVSTNNERSKEEKYQIVYIPEDKNIAIVDLNHEYVRVWKYGPVELSETHYEQGLYIETYEPTIQKLLNSNKNERKYIFKFAYDKKGGEPVLVTEISFTSKSNYQIKLYYTDYYYELASKRRK